MTVDVLLGLQWGDEGKGKIVDYLAPKYDVVARFQGGPNAGHTLEFDGIKHVLHQIPSGIFRPNIQNIIGNGVVLDPVVFKKEIEGLSQYNLKVTDNLMLSTKAHLIIPTHRLLDAAYEHAKGDKKIGSTLKGIGPTYQDKVARRGLRIGDVLRADFKERYGNLVKNHCSILDYLGFKYEGLDELAETFFAACEYLKEFNIAETEYAVNEALGQEKTVLAEGAQGSLLDVEFGSYPFVTSSNTTTSGACAGLGFAPNKVGEVYGIFKAYCTRVGSGPFPTELHDETGEAMRKEGNEFGATTGRARRCGWIDLPALKYTIMLNGVTQLFMMKADVLNIFEEIKVCTHYLMNGQETHVWPTGRLDTELVPVLETLKGWHCNLDHVKEYADFPPELSAYVSYLEEKLGVPINIVSLGPDRSQTIIKEELKEALAS